MTNAAFDHHRVSDDGLHIFATVTGGQFSGQRVEILIDRETAESFGWIDPQEESLGSSAKTPLKPKRRRRSRRKALQELEKWNALTGQDASNEKN